MSRFRLVRRSLEGQVEYLEDKIVELIAEKDNAYRERNDLVEVLAAQHSGVLCPAPDAEGYVLVFVESPAGQVSWHVREDQGHRFTHAVQRVSEWEWDGHSQDDRRDRLKVWAERGTP